MNWGVWSTTDLSNGLGGMEVHARCVVRELKKRGIKAEIINKADPNLEAYEVLQTHGDAFSWQQVRNIERWRKVDAKRRWIHTLHGFTGGRMNACREWFWLGGIRSCVKEIWASKNADLCAVVHPRLLSPIWAPKGMVCGNGWDSALIENSGMVTEKACNWLFVGRGEDRVKNISALLAAWNLVKETIKFKNEYLVTIPGDGFPSEERIQKTGRLTPEQVADSLRKSHGMILTSVYEGNSLAVLEALAQGALVVSTPVGLAPELSKSAIRGFYMSRDFSPEAIAEAWEQASQDASRRSERISFNQAHLWRWSRVVENMLRCLNEKRTSP